MLLPISLIDFSGYTAEALSVASVEIYILLRNLESEEFKIISFESHGNVLKEFSTSNYPESLKNSWVNSFYISESSVILRTFQGDVCIGEINGNELNIRFLSHAQISESSNETFIKLDKVFLYDLTNILGVIDLKESEFTFLRYRDENVKIINMLNDEDRIIMHTRNNKTGEETVEVIDIADLALFFDIIDKKIL